jgi:hypothetical protein
MATPVEILPAGESNNLLLDNTASIIAVDVCAMAQPKKALSLVSNPSNIPSQNPASVVTDP